MKNASALALAATASTLFTACLFQGQSDSASRASVNLEIRAAASTASAQGAPILLGDSTGSRIAFTEAKLVVSRIKLESESDSGDCDSSLKALRKEPGEAGSENEVETECEDEQELSLKGPFVIDLLTGASVPDLSTLSVPAGIYRKVKVEMHHGQGDSSLGGKSLVASGTVTLADGTIKPFSLALTLDENLKIESRSGIALDGGSVKTVLVRLMSENWLRGLDVAACLAGADSAADLVVSEGSALGKCLDAEHRIKDNFRHSFEAGEKEDRHGSDDIDSTEDRSGRDSTDDHSGKGK